MSRRTLLEINDVKKHFILKRTSFFEPRRRVYAVDGVTFDLRSGETLGLVGESGCGKSTLGRTILRLITPTSGSICFNGKDVIHIKGKELKSFRSMAQIIFQDPYSSLNPRLNILQIVGDALKAHGLSQRSEIADRVTYILGKVGIHKEKLKSFPHEFSGGQRQRIGIARALILEPKLIVCDEPVSALDVSIQAQIINLLADLKEKYGLSYIMIAHDLSVINHVSDRIAVMYLGKIIELASKRELITNSLHPYTRALISAIPVLDPDRKKKRIILKGEPPSPINPPAGCRFHPRCWEVMSVCRSVEPKWMEIKPDHYAMCHLYEACRP